MNDDTDHSAINHQWIKLSGGLKHLFSRFILDRPHRKIRKESYERQRRNKESYDAFQLSSK